MLAFEMHPFAHPLDALLATPFAYSRRLGRCDVLPSFARHVTASVAEHPDSYVVTVQAPGIRADNLSTSFEDDILTVASSSESSHGTFSFKRQAKLPNADALTATATHENGVLTVTLKKLAPPEPVRIAVSSVTDTEDEAGEVEPKPYTLTIAAPGVKASDICIEALQATLSINGETSSGAHGSFGVHRAYKLPRDADATAATAATVDGILTITLPTKPVPGATAIKISTAATAEAEVEKAGQSQEAVVKQSEETEAVHSAEVQVEAPTAEEAAAEEWLAEWDTMLDDLAEMGFEDRESGRAALTKHSGSLKRAVKELVAKRAGM